MDSDRLHTHPLAEQIKAPAGKWLLLRAPHEWTHVPEAKLHDIYEVLDFELPDKRAAWRDLALPAPIRVPVKLTRSGTAEAAELWVLREAGIAQLEEFVRSADNALLARLAFAVGEHDGLRIVVLRVRPSKAAAPVLVIDGLACRSFLRIPNLFLPIGQSLYPPLRRDAVVKLLAGDAARVTWLTPHADGTFTPESLADDAFRPLSEWIDYVWSTSIRRSKAGLARRSFNSRVSSARMTCRKRKKPPKEPTGPKPAKKPEGEEVGDRPKDIAVVEKKLQKADAFIEPEVAVEPGELDRRLRELEEAYSTLNTPLEDPDRQALWREMAALNGALNHPGDMAVCWSNALWEAPSVPADWPREWLRLETKQNTPPTG